MKKKFTQLTLFLFISITFIQTTLAQNFVHPGLPFTINDLDRMEANRNSVSPWKESWEIILNTNEASLDYIMQGPTVDVENKGNDGLYIADVHAMLYHALQWYFTKDDAHAELAISLIESWASTHKTWSGTSAHLGAAWRGGTMAQACEILRYTYPRWTDELTLLTENYFEEVFWPLFRLPDPLRAANQGANNLMGAMYVAIYINDQEKFDICIDAFLNDACGGIQNTLPNGQNGDTGRDQGHAMGMIGNLATVCELAWAQGIDLYSVLDNRMLQVHEYWCKYNLGEEVEYIPHGTCYDFYPTIGSDGRNPASNSAIPVTELLYGAYAMRKGLPAPYITSYREAMGIDETTFIFAKDETFLTTAPFNKNPHPLLTTTDVTSLTGADIGSITATGTETFDNGTWTVEGAGTNVYGGSSDEFYFAYKQMNGDGSLIAKVNSIENTSSSAKAAVVIRESLDTDGKVATMALTPSAGSFFNSRGFDSADGDGSQSDADVTGPFWIKIERRGVNIVGYVSSDGISWSPHQNTVFTMSDDYYIGLGVSSSSSSSLCTSVFTDVKLGTLTEDTEDLGTYSQIEAENYIAMSGIETEITSDDNGGENVHAVNTDDWMEYEINVLYAGMYSIDYRVASASVDGNLLLSIGDETLEQLTFTATGGDDNWTTVSSIAPIYLTKGIQTIRLTANSDDWKINWLRLRSQCKDVPLISYVETLDSLGISLGSEQNTELTIFPGNTAKLKPTVTTTGSWNWTGPNEFTSEESTLAFENIDEAKSGEYIVNFTNECGLINTDTFKISVVNSLYFEAENYTAMEGIIVEATDDISGTSHVTNIESDDWFEYEIDVPFSALYNVNYRIKSDLPGSFSTLIDGDEIEQVSFIADEWTTIISSKPVFLKKGIQTLRINSLSDSWKLNWIELDGLQTVKDCALPYSKEAFRIYNDNIVWASGPMDITCEDIVDLHVIVQGIGTFDPSDYLNIYYKIDGGERIILSELTGVNTKQMLSLTEFSGNTLEVIIEAAAGTTGIYDVKGVYVIKSKDPFERIEAEDYDAKNGTSTETCSDTGGGLNVGSINDGNWLMFSNINYSEISHISARLSHRNSSEGTIEVRLGSETGQLVGTINMPNTGNWQNWETVSTDLKSEVGIYDVYLVFNHPSTYVGNINWLQFSAVTTPVKEIVSHEKHKVYPNPVEDLLYISDANGATVEVYNTNGQLVLNDKVSSEKGKIDFSALSPGVYIVKITKDGSVSVNKVLKKY